MLDGVTAADEVRSCSVALPGVIARPCSPSRCRGTSPVRAGLRLARRAEDHDVGIFSSS